MIEELGKLVPFSSAIFIAMEASGLFSPDGHFSVAIPPKALSAFTNYYATVHPFTLTGWIRHTNETARITDFVPAYRLQDTEYGGDFLPLTPCFYELGVIMGAQGDRVGALCLHRQKIDRDFSDREVQIINYLAPHMARAINCLQLLERLNAGGFSSETGIVRMQADGEVTMNEAARKISLENPGPFYPNLFKKSDALISEPSKSRYRIRTTSSNQGSEHILLFEPLPYTETLFQRLCRWDFTDRQAEIVLKVIRGASNREIAMALSVSEQTIKEHLRNIFEKVKVRRRSELISIILSDS
nr:LuxR C-terminal-related transcriptional regulator [Ferrovum sp.]